MQYIPATLNPNGLNGTVSLNGITSTIVNYNGGQYVIEGGYLDVGIIDTMKDLMVNCIGAVVFSIIGILYIKHRGKGKIAKSFISAYENNRGNRRNSKND